MQCHVYYNTNCKTIYQTIILIYISTVSLNLSYLFINIVNWGSKSYLEVDCCYLIQHSIHHSPLSHVKYFLKLKFPLFLQLLVGMLAYAFQSNQ